MCERGVKHLCAVATTLLCVLHPSFLFVLQKIRARLQKENMCKKIIESISHITNSLYWEPVSFALLDKLELSQQHAGYKFFRGFLILLKNLLIGSGQRELVRDASQKPLFTLQKKSQSRNLCMNKNFRGCAFLWKNKQSTKYPKCILNAFQMF